MTHNAFSVLVPKTISRAQIETKRETVVCTIFARFQIIFYRRKSTGTSGTFILFLVLPWSRYESVINDATCVGGPTLPAGPTRWPLVHGRRITLLGRCNPRKCRSTVSSQVTFGRQPIADLPKEAFRVCRRRLSRRAVIHGGIWADYKRGPESTPFSGFHYFLGSSYFR